MKTVANSGARQEVFMHFKTVDIDSRTNCTSWKTIKKQYK